ncbi:MAG: PH domain-containing protein [Elusimicrobia bacterium]|nr:PH domain-containing protein [Elusimicrobiota bacterium]
MIQNVYKNTWGAKVSLITGVVVSALSFAAVSSVDLLKGADNSDKTLGQAMLVLIITIVLLAYFWRTTEYILDEKHLIINRPIGSIKIELARINGYERLDEKSISNALMLFGSGGLFGFHGIFSSGLFGKYYAYYANSDNLVLVKADKTIIISPENPREFINDLKERVEK